MTARVLAGVLSTAALAASATGQSQDLADHLRRARYDITLTDGRVEGAGATWLVAEASKAQFFFVGEEHDTREIPLVLAALWPKLMAAGYRHVAIEAGQWLGGRVDRFARSADRDALDQFRRAVFPRRPNVSVPPSSNEDIELYSAMARTASSGSAQSSPLIWGLDHEFTIAPLLERLELLTRDTPAHGRVATLHRDVAHAERQQSYNLRPFATDISRLVASISAPELSEQGQLLDALRRRVAVAGSDQERGDVFRQLFVRNYRAAQAGGEPTPRVMLRFGHYHAKRGLMFEYGTSTLANFVAEFARLEDSQLFNVMFIACSLTSRDDWRAPREHPRACSPRERAWLSAFARRRSAR